MTTQTMVWSKYGGTEIKEYPDMKLYEDNDIMIFTYYGQNCGKRDHLISSGALLIIKNNKNNYMHIGKIINVLNIGTEKITRSVVSKKDDMIKIKEYDVVIYKLIISKMEKKLAKTKNDLCQQLNLSIMNSYERTNGITSHSILTNRIEL